MKPSRKPIVITEDHYLSLTQDSGGFCLACGDEAYGIEPDARRYECESCDAKQVYGAEELLIMGLITFKTPKPQNRMDLIGHPDSTDDARRDEYSSDYYDTHDKSQE